MRHPKKKVEPALPMTVEHTLAIAGETWRGSGDGEEKNELLSFSGGGRANSMVSTDRTKSGLFVAYLTDFMIHTALVRVCVCVRVCGNVM
jgi:hypothetical protein